MVTLALPVTSFDLVRSSMENFTPLSAIIGGALIGVSAVMLMALNGRVAGISGIFSGIATAGRGDRSWRLSFVAGLVAAPLIFGFVAGEMPAIEITSSWPLIIIAGLLVGFGTRLGSGCTSGHGVCGLSRLSLRSIISVGIFMIVGVIAATLMRHVFTGGTGSMG